LYKDNNTRVAMAAPKSSGEWAMLLDITKNELDEKTKECNTMQQSVRFCCIWHEYLSLRSSLDVIFMFSFVFTKQLIDAHAVIDRKGSLLRSVQTGLESMLEDVVGENGRVRVLSFYDFRSTF
jgi:hypothetical protein